MDPIRLLEQPDLSARERAALEAGCTQLPVAYDVAAGAARLAQSLGANTTAAATQAVAFKLGIKLIAGIALVSAGLALWVATDAEPAAIVPAPIAKTAAPPALVAPQLHAASPEAIPEAEPVAVPAQPVVPKPARAPSKRRVTSVAPPVATTQAPEQALANAPGPVLEAESEPEPEVETAKPAPEEKRAPAPSPALLEMKAIARAKRALADDEPAETLAILAATARDFPRGYFIEERRALRVLALAERGEGELARREASAFLRDYPQSSFAERVRQASR